MSLKILIDDPLGRYSPGQSIFGRVFCKLKDVDAAVEIKLKLIGEECTQCDATPASIGRTINRGSKKAFLETKNIHLHSGLLQGREEFRFSLVLPLHIPSTYHGKYGYVKFVLRASLDLQWHQKCEQELELMIFSPIDLNIQSKKLDDSYMKSNTHSDKVILNQGLFFGPEVIKLHVTLYKKVFDVNETIPVEVVVTNKSNSPVTKVTAKIFANIEASLGLVRGKHELLSTYNILAAEQEDGVRSERQTTLRFNLKVCHEDELQNFDKCTLFSQRCFLEVTASIDYRSNLKIEVDLTLGHIPVNNQSTGNVRAKPRVLDFAILRRIPFEGESSSNMLMSNSSSLTSLPSGSSGAPPSHFARQLSSSYSNILPEAIVFNIPPSFLVSSDTRSSIEASRGGPIPSAPAADDGDDAAHPEAFGSQRARSGFVSWQHRSSGLDFPAPIDGVIDAPPSYEEAMGLIKKENTSQN